MRYLSLTFLADTPDADARAAAKAILARLEGSALKASLPEVFDVVLVTVTNAGGENYVGQIDLLLDGDLDTDRRFLSVRLLPAVRQCTGVKADEMVWWDSAESRPTPPAGRTRRAAEPAQTAAANEDEMLKAILHIPTPTPAA